LLTLGVCTLVAQRGGDQPKIPDAPAVLDYLNQSIDWHRQLLAQEGFATDPADLLFADEARQIGNQALQLSFDFAKADAEVLAQQKPETAAQQPSNAQRLAQAASEADGEVKQRQQQLQALKEQIPSARGAKRQQLGAQLGPAESELQLEQARSEMLHNLLQFAGAQGGAGGNLGAQVEELRRSIPELETGNAKAATTAVTNAPSRSGLVALVEELLAVHSKLSTLDGDMAATDRLAARATELRRPLIKVLMKVEEQGDAAIENSDMAATQKQQLDALTARFRQLAAVTLPLAKQSVLLAAYKDNLQRWRAAVHDQYVLDAKRLALRLTILAIVIALLAGLAEVWRRAIFRYVRDLRHRYQFLLLRRIVIWVAIGIAVAFALASEVGSVATFVGLITAGVAVALQSVIMAVAGYFFLIGKYGVSVGDRVQIAGVTGDVLDIGLVRLHLMEVGNTDTGRQPTGRVVVFSNAIVFQPGASFFKQIPGTNFAWHQVSLTLAPTTDYQLAEKRMLEAVESVYAEYREHIERQHRRMQDTLNVTVDLPSPRSRLHFGEDGLRVAIRFPVEIERAPQIDDEVTRRVLAAIQESPKLRLVGSGVPNIQPVDEAPQAKAS
jgi:small-conductance mechanosensitive channel